LKKKKQNFTEFCQNIADELEELHQDFIGSNQSYKKYKAVWKKTREKVGVFS